MEKGRQLKSFDSNSYTYNHDGIRISKTVNGVVKTSKTILKTAISSKKIVMYTSKIKKAIVSTVINSIRYIVSAVANTLGSSGKKYVKGLLG